MNFLSMKTKFVFIFFIVSFYILKSQDITYTRFIDSTLSSPEFVGRGYVDNGEKKAAKFIASQLKEMKIQKLGKSYFQPFKFSINTIIKDNGVIIDNRNLKPGIDYQIAANSPTLSGTFSIVFLPDSLFDNKEALNHFFSNPDLKNKFILTEKRFKELKYLTDLPAKGIIYLNSNKIIWSVSHAQKQSKFVTIDVLDSIIDLSSKFITLNFSSKFIIKYNASNIYGFVEGKTNPDSFIIFTAHFDHLGKMGSVYFPGASDNASGSSMVLNLAKYYNQPANKPPVSIIFILLSGEEVGLLGSTYCAEHLPVAKQRIKCLINLDMVSTGSDGITVVNASKYPDIYEKLLDINEKMEYLSQIKKRGESCNSDHCPFDKKGIPSIFIYTMGNENREYHSITDTYDKITFTKYSELFRLLTDFVNQY